MVRGQNLNERLNMAIIATGGRGGGNLASVESENIVALCDVNEASLAPAVARHPRARKFADFRKLYDHAKDFDAVVVSTPEHAHAFATLPALQLGKHVYCEKPLTHDVWEARIIREAAAKAKVATQMGTQIHAGDNYRRVVELIQSGAIGPVCEVHVWVSRSLGTAERRKRQDKRKTSCLFNNVPTSRKNRPRGLIGTCGSVRRPGGLTTTCIFPDQNGIAGGTSEMVRCRIWAAIGSTCPFGR